MKAEQIKYIHFHWLSLFICGHFSVLSRATSQLTLLNKASPATRHAGKFGCGCKCLPTFGECSEKKIFARAEVEVWNMVARRVITPRAFTAGAASFVLKRHRQINNTEARRTQHEDKSFLESFCRISHAIFRSLAEIRRDYAAKMWHKHKIGCSEKAVGFVLFSELQ